VELTAAAAACSRGPSRYDGARPGGQPRPPDLQPRPGGHAVGDPNSAGFATTKKPKPDKVDPKTYKYGKAADITIEGSEFSDTVEVKLESNTADWDPSVTKDVKSTGGGTKVKVKSKPTKKKEGGERDDDGDLIVTVTND